VADESIGSLTFQKDNRNVRCSAVIAITARGPGHQPRRAQNGVGVAWRSHRECRHYPTAL